MGIYDSVVEFEQETLIGTINGKSVYYKAHGELQPFYKDARVASYLKASGSLNNNYRHIDISYDCRDSVPASSRRHSVALSQLGTSYKQISSAETFYGTLSGNALLPPYVYIKIYTTVLGVTTVEIETTVTLTCVSDFDYSPPTVNCNSVTCTTNKAYIDLLNITASHSDFNLYSLRATVVKRSTSETLGARSIYDINTKTYSNACIEFQLLPIEWDENNNPIRSLRAGDIADVTIEVTCWNGRSATWTSYFTAPTRVIGVSAEYPGTLRVGTDKQLNYTVTGEDGRTPTIQTVTFSSSSSSVATINSSGVIHPVAPGTCTISVESDDDYASHYIDSVEITVTSGTFPSFSSDYDKLSKDLMDDIEDACNQLSAITSIIIEPLTNYNGYSTWLRHMYEVLDTTNENVKTLCTASASIHHTLPDSFPQENTSGVWKDIINEWVELIQEIYEVVS